MSQYLSGVVFSTPQLNSALVTASQQKVGTPISQFFLLCFHYSPITGKYGRLIMVLVRVCGVLTFILCLAGGIVIMLRSEGKAAPKPETARKAAP